MKLLDNYIDRYVLRKLAREIEEQLYCFNVDERVDLGKNHSGRYCLEIYIKLRQENDKQYELVFSVSSKRATYLLCNIESVNKQVIRNMKQILKEKHERLGR